MTANNSPKSLAPAPSSADSLARAARDLETVAIFRRLRELMQACKANKNDRMIVLIAACIDEGFDKWPRIEGAVKCLGFDEKHARIVLNKSIGVQWTRDESGIYRNLC